MALLLPFILVPFVVIVLALRSRYGLSWWGAFWRRARACHLVKERARFPQRRRRDPFAGYLP